VGRVGEVDEEALTWPYRCTGLSRPFLPVASTHVGPAAAAGLRAALCPMKSVVE
jgi:hypothetical protein